MRCKLPLEYPSKLCPHRKKAKLGPHRNKAAATIIAAKGTRWFWKIFPFAPRPPSNFCTAAWLPSNWPPGMCIWVNQALPLASSKRWKRPKALKGYRQRPLKKGRQPGKTELCIGNATKKLSSSKRMKANMLIPKRKDMRHVFLVQSCAQLLKVGHSLMVSILLRRETGHQFRTAQSVAKGSKMTTGKKIANHVAGGFTPVIS